MIEFDPTALGLLAAAGADPDDDAPRLVFADWLEERGGEDERAWAELIRLQIQRARLVPRSEADKLLSPRDDELTRRLKDRLVRPLPRVPGMIPAFRRGMLWLSAHARHFLNHEETMRAWLREQGPSVVSVCLNDFPAARTADLTAELQEGLPPIDLRFNRGAAKDVGLARAAQLSRMMELAAPWSQVSDKGLAHLRGLKRLRSLTLEAPKVTDRGVEYVAELTGLHHLSLTHVQLTDDCVARLAALSNLRSLILSGSKVTDVAASHVSGMLQLRRLMLTLTAITDRGLELISRLPNLEWLILDQTAVTDAGLMHLREASRLRALKVDQTAVTPAGKDALRAALPDLYVYN